MKCFNDFPLFFFFLNVLTFPHLSLVVKDFPEGPCSSQLLDYPQETGPDLLLLIRGKA